MTERERLIELLRKDAACDTADCEKCLTKKNCYQILTADYLLEKGVIVPRCKIGDKLYTLIYDNVPKEWYIAEEPITEVGKKGLFISLDAGFFDYIPYLELGKDYFLNKEEAEKALEEREKDENRVV